MNEALWKSGGEGRGLYLESPGLRHGWVGSTEWPQEQGKCVLESESGSLGFQTVATEHPLEDV